MTAKEAIDILNGLRSANEYEIAAILGTWYSGIKKDVDRAIGMAIEALEKQMPKKAELDAYDELICPVCGADVEWKRYCEECGQKIYTGAES